jgi:hypothetical protein
MQLWVVNPGKKNKAGSTYFISPKELKHSIMMMFLEFYEPFLVSLYKKKTVWFTTKHWNARNKPKSKWENHIDGRLSSYRPASPAPAALLPVNPMQIIWDWLKGGSFKYNMVLTLQEELLIWYLRKPKPIIVARVIASIGSFNTKTYVTFGDDHENYG